MRRTLIPARPAARALAVAWLALGAGHALAMPTDWRVMPESSRVSFHYVESGVEREGTFERFSGTGRLDGGNPAGATLDITVESRSISLGNRLVDAFATSAEWFDSANHPEVVYQLTGLEPVEGNRYVATGVLSVRGVEQPITAPVTLDIGAERAHATGELSLDRYDYGLGVGPSAAFVEIGRGVSVRFDLTARPVR